MIRKKKHVAAGATSEAASYKLTERERAALNKQIERKNSEPVAPRLKVEEGEKSTKISFDHPHQIAARGLLMEALGTANFDFNSEFIKQLAQLASRKGKVDTGELNFLLSVIKGIKPNDQLEAMLGAQMAGVHTIATMTFAEQLSRVETVPQQDSAERTFNKLTRTFVMQMEALKRYRTGGEQKVTVQHVSVGEGGQAIVGNVTQAAPETSRKKPQPSRPLLPTRGRSRWRQLSIRRPPSRSRFSAGESAMTTSDHKRNTGPMLSSQRCGARTRSGKPCKSPAVSGKKRCRMHGGAPGSGAPRGNKNALKHGLYTRDAIEQRRQTRDLLRQSRMLIAKLT